MQVKAAVAPAQGADLDIRELELDDYQPDELRVRMVGSGICHTDAIVRDQWYPVPLPAVLGHEGSGVVEAVGANVQGFAVGDHVVLGPATCGDCRNCTAGHPQYCDYLFPFNFGGCRPDGSKAFRDGDTPISSHFFGQSSFAEAVNVRARNAVKVSPEVPLELLGPLGCGLNTGAGAVLNVLKPVPGSSIAIFGTGAVGLAGMLGAIAAGASQIIMVDIVPSRLEFALGLGATDVVNSKAGDPVEAIRELTGGLGVNLALDTTGVPQVFSQMTKALAVRGHGALVGAAPLGTDAAFDIGTLLTSGITISMVVEGDSVPRQFIPLLIGLYQAGRFPFDQLIKTYPFAEINQALDDSLAGGTIKPVVVF
ncbi:MAG: NAD(P)-dependent alcohol dehydrogenase [Bifidobacteriaceae bacterium]|jgi:aryl-alcohol dehydrogenase|nr:NAD(P)-dependent alcohol dehydrogenase [Bifidobacteriaceae bacterium]